MSFKVDPDKGFRILRSVAAPVIFVNGLVGSGTTEFVNRFRSENYDILRFKDPDPMVLLRHLNSRKERNLDRNPIMIEANIPDAHRVAEIFRGDFCFTYVYVYSNNPKRYRARLDELRQRDGIYIPPEHQHIRNMLDKIQQTDGIDRSELLNKLTIDLSQLNTTTYDKHLSMFDNKILTILT